MQVFRGSKTLLVAFLAAAVFIAGCGGEETQDDQSTEQNTQEQTVERTNNKDRTKEETKVGKKGANDKDSGEVVLEIGGDPGTAFSGTCSVGDEENELSGEVPESFSYELGGEQLKCEIRKENTDSGTLEVLLTGPGDRIQQRTDSPGGTISLSYSENSVSSSTSSSGSSSSVNQVVNSSSGSSSSTSSSVSSR